MASEDIIARFRLDINGLNEDISKIKEKLGDVEKGAGKTAKNSAKEFDHFGNTVNKLGQRLIAVFAVERIISFGRAIINTTAEFQKFEAVLTNTLGSSGRAKIALKNITDFAAKTPFSVQQLTNAFVKLANQGFVPTVEEMRKLGDLASSTGKEFDQLAEAIIDAQTGEFERLKEFGIRAQKEGDKVKFTFKGVKTEVDFTNESIRNYILSLGDAEGVSGAMAAISETLGGKISNLGDSYDQLLLAVGKTSSDLSGSMVDALKEVLDWTTELIKETSNLKEIYGSGLLTKEQVNENITFWTKLNGAQSSALATVKALFSVLTDDNENGTKELSEYQIQVQNLQSIVKNAAQEQNSLSDEQIKKTQQAYDLLIKIGEAGVFDPFTAQRLRELGLIIEEFKEEVKEAEGENKKTNETLKTRRQILEDLIKKEEYILQLKVGQEKESKKAIDNLINYKGELSELITEEEFRLSFVNMVLDLKKEEIKLSEEENEKFREKVKLMKEAKGVMMQEAKGVLTDDSDTKPKIVDKDKQKEAIEIFQASASAIVDLAQETNRQLNDLDQQRYANMRILEERQLLDVQKAYDKKLITYEDYLTQTDAIRAENENKIREQQRKAAQREKALNYFSAVINTASAVTNALNTKPFFPLGLIMAGTAAAQGAIQVAAISSAPVPQFEKGGYIKGKRHKQGGVLIEAEGGEYMVNRQGTARHLEVIEAINNGYFDKLIYQDWVLPAIEQQKKEFTKLKNKDFASNLADSLVVKAMIDEDRLINSDKNTRKILIDIRESLSRSNYHNKRHN